MEESVRYFQLTPASIKSVAELIEVFLQVKATDTVIGTQ
jgi:hypothetical protein